MSAYQKQVPMRIQARAGSKVEQAYFAKSGLPGLDWPMPRAIAPDIAPAPMEDLIFHGGKVVPHMEFQNIYLGGTGSWTQSDVQFIDDTIQHAMEHKQMNNVMQQYFPGAKLACEMRPSIFLSQSKPARLTDKQIHDEVIALLEAKHIADRDLDSCLFNLLLPAGTVLAFEDMSSLEGLGGYHSSLHVSRDGHERTLYFSANAFSERLPDGQENGIVAFDQSWKSVVATLYHEINEFRTDADVNDAIEKNDNDFLGWSSRRGREVGDQPIFQAGSKLNQVFKEISDRPRKVLLPVQLLYSNAVHGAEGPIAKPHAKAAELV
ncbi:hypothetical protein [Caballeronia sp. ATUFL_F1_KS39]|uniref:hypothetical protein n=1 Tax=Caballeronia sp. ATUFL_F1_KS39 TaxID=2921766 RepID=UPI0020281D49|nr:hypothetical protein [Caballeronia sp. ATUFL_F1_KS39]